MATYSTTLKSMTGSIDARGVRHYVRVYMVASSVLDDEPDTIVAQVPFEYYDSYPTDLPAMLKSKRAEPMGGEYGFWTVTLEWDTEQSESDKGTVQAGQPGTAPTEPGGNTPATPPPMRPWVIKWGSVQVEEPLVKDVSDDEVPVTNSAGQPFDPPVTVPRSHTTLQITAFRAEAQEEKIRVFKNKVNQADFLGLWPRGWVRCTDYQVQSVYENGAWFWQVDVSLEMKEDGWNPIRVLDAGTVERSDPDGAGLRLRAITDSTGAVVTSPVPLDGVGRKLRADEDPVYLEFQGYYEADFTQLI